ncbi:MAG: DNA polymerase III subunit chi [Xanthomonadales bacterium]
MTGSCQVDFYVLDEGGFSAEQLACDLALMAWEQGHQIAVLTETTDLTNELDELMWDYPAGRFLPHSAEPGDTRAPVTIGQLEMPIPGDSDLIINLTKTTISEPDRFKRLLEIVPANPVQRTASRHKFRSYREQGLDPASHPVGKRPGEK